MNSRTKKGLIAAGVVAVLGVGGAAVAVGTDEAGDDDATQKAITGSALYDDDIRRLMGESRAPGEIFGAIGTAVRRRSSASPRSPRASA